MAIRDISKITDYLYLGNMYAAYNIIQLKNIGIEKILTVMNEFRNKYSKSIFIHKIIEIEDIYDENIIKYFKECINFIDGKKIVFVHCAAGISRSSTIVIAYIMWKYKKNLRDAINFVKMKRPIIFPNPGFIDQLKIFEKLLKENRYDLDKINFNKIKVKTASKDCIIM